MCILRLIKYINNLIIGEVESGCRWRRRECSWGRGVFFSPSHVFRKVFQYIFQESILLYLFLYAGTWIFFYLWELWKLLVALFAFVWKEKVKNERRKRPNRQIFGGLCPQTFTGGPELNPVASKKPSGGRFNYHLNYLNKLFDLNAGCYFRNSGDSTVS